MKHMKHMKNKRNSGMTSLEIIVASSILAAVILAALQFCGSMVENSEHQICTVAMETKSNQAVKKVVDLVRESNGGKTALVSYSLGSCNYTALIFPNPRNKDGEFVRHSYDEYGDPVYTGVPNWQGFTFLYVNKDKELVAYHDYRCAGLVDIPSFPYPGDFEDDPDAWPSLIYKNKGVEYELPKDRHVANTDLDIVCEVIARDVTCFLVTPTTTGLKFYIVTSRSRGKMEVRAAYQEELRIRNSN